MRFHRLPKEKLRRERWIRAMKRQNLPQTANTYVCSVHFSTGTGSTMERQPPMADPSIFLHVSKPVKSRRTRTSLGARTTGGGKVSLSPAAPSISASLSSQSEPFPLLPITQPPADVASETVDELTLLRRKVAKLEKENKAMEVSLKRLESTRLSFERLAQNAENFKFYTGIDLSAFQDVLVLLADSPGRMSYVDKGDEVQAGRGQQGPARRLSVQDELLLTLVKLRHDFPEADLACRFGVSQSSVSRIFTAWISCLFFLLKS